MLINGSLAKVGSWKVGLKLYCGDEQQTAGVRLVRSEPEGAAMSSRILMSACRLATTGSPVWSKELPVEVTEMARWRKIGWKLADQREKTWCLSLVLLTTPTPQRPNTRLQVASPLVTNCATLRLYNWWDGRVSSRAAQSCDWVGPRLEEEQAAGWPFAAVFILFDLRESFLQFVCRPVCREWTAESGSQQGKEMAQFFTVSAARRAYSVPPGQPRAAAGRGGNGGLGEGSRTGFAWHWSG